MPMQGQRGRERERECVCVCVSPSLSPLRAHSQPSCLGTHLGTWPIKFSLAGLVKAVNTAVDLIVAHFGTSRDPGVKVGERLGR